VIASSLIVAACAGRSPAPVATVQAQDVYMTCTMIIAEVEANNAKVQQLASDKGLKVTQNVAAGVAGIFIPVLWFGMDFQGAEDKEIAALQARQHAAVRRHDDDNRIASDVRVSRRAARLAVPERL
jgi:uncharacterized protein YcfL